MNTSFCGFTKAVRLLLKMSFTWDIRQWAKQTKMFIEWRNLSSDKEESLSMKLLTCSEVHLGQFRAFWVSIWTLVKKLPICAPFTERGAEGQSWQCLLWLSREAWKRARVTFKDNRMWWCGCIESLRNQATVSLEDLFSSLARKSKTNSLLKCEEHAHYLFWP